MEIWKDVIGYEGIYQVSNIGRVKSFRLNKETYLKLRHNKDGYLVTGLSLNKKQKMFLVHRLVGISFIDNPKQKETINHINGIKTDNMVKNLEWNTRSENIRHADKTGLRVMKSGEDCYKSKLKSEDVINIRMSKLRQKELAKIYNINPSAISNIIRRINWKHI